MTEGIISRFDSTLRKFNKVNYDLLLPPLEDSTLSEKVLQLDVTDSDLHFLYKWKNGYDPSKYEEGNTCHIFEFDTIMTFDDVVETTESAKKFNYWSPIFIPFMTDFTGQYILYNNNINSGEYGRLFLSSASLLSVEPSCYYDSIPKMMETIIAAYEQEIFILMPGSKRLDIQYDKLASLCMKMNKYSTFYR